MHSRNTFAGFSLQAWVWHSHVNYCFLFKIYSLEKQVGYSKFWQTSGISAFYHSCWKEKTLWMYILSNGNNMTCYLIRIQVPFIRALIEDVMDWAGAALCSLGWVCSLTGEEWEREGRKKSSAAAGKPPALKPRNKGELSLYTQELFTLVNDMIVRRKQHTVPGI